MFVRTIHGEYYPVTSIERLWDETDEQGQRIEQVCLNGGAVHRLFDGEFQRLLDIDCHPFAAAPDTYVLQEVVDDGNRIALDKIPVLGWVVSASRGVLPITIEGVNHGLDRTAAVLMPSGEVVLAMNCTYANEQCYFAEVRSSFRSS